MRYRSPDSALPSSAPCWSVRASGSCGSPSGITKALALEEVAGVGPEGRVVDHAAPIALEVTVRDAVEAYQGGEQPHVSLGTLAAHQLALRVQPLLQPVETGEQRGDGRIIGALRRGEGGFVDTQKYQVQGKGKV